MNSVDVASGTFLHVQRLCILKESSLESRLAANK
jgi:hypothetical protein